MLMLMSDTLDLWGITTSYPGLKSDMTIHFNSRLERNMGSENKLSSPKSSK